MLKSRISWCVGVFLKYSTAREAPQGPWSAKHAYPFLPRDLLSLPRSVSTERAYADAAPISERARAHNSANLQVNLCARVRSQKRVHAALNAGMCSQDAPRCARKMAQGCRKMAPRWPQRWPQDGPKMAPRWPQDGPKRPQDGPKMAPRWPQDGPKMAPGLGVGPCAPQFQARRNAPPSPQSPPPLLL